MSTYITRKTSRNAADVVNDIVLDEKPGNTRKVFRGMIVENEGNPEECVRGYILHQRKKSSDHWEDVKSINLNTLKGGEGVKLELRSHHTKELYDALTHLYEIARDGVPKGEKEWTVERTDQIIKIDENRRVLVQRLLEQDFGDEVWNELLDQSPDLATKLANARVQQNRAQSLQIFAQALEGTSQVDEQWWQSFFAKNTWIFGYGLNYQFLHLLSEQADYGGRSYSGKGSQKGDFLMNSVANVQFTVLVEIKKPNSPLFQINTKREFVKHRNGTLLFHSELTGGVSQLQSNYHKWYTEGSKRADDNEKLNSQNIFTYQPKGILVIGDTNQLKQSIEARSTFELYRQNLSNPEIITFDELYERAKFIVNQTETKLRNQITVDEADYGVNQLDELDDDLPF